MKRFAGGLVVLWTVLFLREIDTGAAASGHLLLGAGALFIFAYLSGIASRSVHLPALTGYLLMGIAIGPYGFGLFSKAMVTDLEPAKNMAISLIALSAGSELDWRWVAKRLRQITTILIVQNAALLAGMFLLLLPLIQSMPFALNPGTDRLLFAFFLAAFSVASSPSVAIAIINECKAKGPLAQTVLGVTVLKDVAVIVLFTMAIAIGKKWGASEADPTGLFSTLVREIPGSILAGLLMGLALSAYLKWIGREITLMTIFSCFLIAELGLAFHMEPLLIGMTAGFLLRNRDSHNARILIHGLERLSLPVYCLFFALSGMSLSLLSLANVGLWALLAVLLRALLLWIGTTLGARLSQSEPTVCYYGWRGFVSQAGVTLAMAAIAADHFSWGPTLQAFTVAIVALNEMVGPILFRQALGGAGEIRH